MSGPTRHALANVSDVGAVLISGVLEAQLIQDVAAVVESARLVCFDFRNVFGEELSPLEQEIRSLSTE